MKKALLILLLVLPLSVQGKIYAVFVGVSEYEQPYSNLTYCDSDAIEMYEMFKEYTPPERMKLLTDKQATHDSIVYYAKQLFLQAQPEDIVIFHFSGHGNKDVFFAHDKVLYFRDLEEIFKECKADRKLIFADACFSGTLRQPGNKADSGNKTNSGNQNTEKGVLLFLSSRSDQSSSESSDIKEGVFTYFLLAGLRGDADANKDRYITARELFDFVNPKVKERSNGQQVPVMWGKFDENMIILKLKNK